MGKRKKSSRKPQGPKKRETLPTTFQCLFCNHEKSVSVKMEKKVAVGTLQCKVCGQTFQTGINYLSAPVDVYAEWIDACDAVAKEAADATGTSAANSYRDIDHGSRPTAGSEAARGGDDFIEDDDVDAEGDYADEDE